VPCKARNPDASRVFYCPFTLQRGGGGERKANAGPGDGRKGVYGDPVCFPRAHIHVLASRVKGKREIASFRPRVIADADARETMERGLPSANPARAELSFFLS